MEFWWLHRGSTWLKHHIHTISTPFQHHLFPQFTFESNARPASNTIHIGVSKKNFTLTWFEHHFQHRECALTPKIPFSRNQHHIRTTCTPPCDVLLVTAPLPHKIDAPISHRTISSHTPTPLPHPGVTRPSFRHHLSIAVLSNLPQVDFRPNVTPFPCRIDTSVSHLNTTSTPHPHPSVASFKLNFHPFQPLLPNTPFFYSLPPLFFP